VWRGNQTGEDTETRDDNGDPRKKEVMGNVDKARDLQTHLPFQFLAVNGSTSKSELPDPQGLPPR
jgi:hypothetical protein